MEIHNEQMNDTNIQQDVSEADDAETPAIEEVEAEVAIWKDKYARLYADLDNTKKRLQRQYAFQAEQKNVQILRDFLPVIDNLERALRHTPGDLAEQSLRLGVEMTLKLFIDTLARYGVTANKAWDQPFDPDLHEAVGFMDQPNLPPGTVAHVEQTGYMIDGSLLRPARVLVTPG